jgi:hypothetical protein
MPVLGTFSADETDRRHETASDLNAECKMKNAEFQPSLRDFGLSGSIPSLEKAGLVSFVPPGHKMANLLRALLLVFVLLPLCAVAKDLYQVRPLSEQQVLQAYTRLLREACQQAAPDWKVSSFDPRAGCWGDSASGGNGGIRTVGSMVLASATVLKYDDSLSTAERRNLLDKAAAALRYATATHFTGAQKCGDGKQWGGLDRPGSKNWQSSYWTSSFAFGAWLIWDQLTPGLQQDVERVVAAQDDLMTKGNPPTGLWSDTKAEENGWCVPCLVLGEQMFPAHPHATTWHETALKYMMNTLCTAADLQDTNLVDGRAVNQWVLGANLQPDYTLENHNHFHPSYVACSSYFLTQAAMYYAYAGHPVPQAASHHLLDTWRMFETVNLPWGETAYPQGMDWELRGLPYINLYAGLGTRGKDAFASLLEQSSLQYQRAWQDICKGSLALPGSTFGITRHAINAEQAAFGFLAHKIWGPAVKPLTPAAADAQLEGVRDYPYVDFIAHRTQKKFASFSWKNQIMGLLMPIEDHGNNPEFTVPISDGFIGSFAIAGTNGKPTVVEHSRHATSGGFETSGKLRINGGQLEQTVRMISIGAQTVVYEDRVTALTNVTVKSERGLPVGIENDSLTGGTRMVSAEGGRMNFDWQKPQPPASLPGTWANVDGRLGVVMVNGGGLIYAQASGYSRGISVYTDILYGSYSDRPRQFQSGAEVAHRVAVLCAEVTPEETAALARSCQIEEKSGGSVLHFKQPNGEVAEVTLIGVSSP